MKTYKTIKVIVATCLLALVFTGCGSKKESPKANNNQQADALYDEANKVFDDDPNGWWIGTRDGSIATSEITIEVDTDKGVYKMYDRVGETPNEGKRCSFSNGVLSLEYDMGFGEEMVDYECSKGKLKQQGKVVFEKIKDPMFVDAVSAFSGKWYRNGSKDDYFEVNDHTYLKHLKENEEYGEPDEKGILIYNLNNYPSPYTGEIVATGVLSASTSDVMGDDYVLRHNGEVLVIAEGVSDYSFYVKEDADPKLIDGYKKMLEILSHLVSGDDGKISLTFNDTLFYLQEVVDEIGNTEPISIGTWEVKDDQTFTLNFIDGTSEDIAFPNEKREFTIKKIDKVMHVDEVF